MSGSFRVQGEDTVTAGPRRGVLSTPHGDVETPAFMPVATQASVKALAPEDLRRIGCEIFITNTYHLSLRPGVETIETLNTGGKAPLELAQTFGNLQLAHDATNFGDVPGMTGGTNLGDVAGMTDGKAPRRRGGR